MQQLVTKGGSNVQALAQDTVLLVGQITCMPPGLTVTVKLQVEMLPQVSAAVTWTVLTPSGKQVPDGGL